MNYENIILECADNGYILSYSTITEKEEGEMPECTRSKQVFPFSKGTEALNQMKKMHGTNKAFPMKKEKSEY